MRLSFTCTVSLVLALASSPLWLFAPTSDASEPVTTLPAEKLKVLDAGRRDCPGMGKFWTGPAVQNQAATYQKLLDEKGPEAIARDLLAAYATPDPSTELEGLAVALLTDAGYKMARSDWQDQALRNHLHRSKKEDPDKLTANVFAIHDAIAASKDSRARDLAAELLLQVSSEGLSNLHNKSGNGTYMQKVKGKLTRVKVEPFPPFQDSRDHTILGPVRTAGR